MGDHVHKTLGTRIIHSYISPTSNSKYNCLKFDILIKLAVFARKMKELSVEEFRRLSAEKKSQELFCLLKENNKLLQVF